ncbi:MAG TPA: GLUG motif-containing protein [Bacteroidota bacterium]
MKKIGYTLAAVILFVLCSGTKALSQVGTPPSGSGTQVSPFLIDSLDNLLWLQDYFYRYSGGDYSKYYKQISDINASATSGWNSGQGFYPIGFSSAIFTGTYDGNGHTIDSLCINRPSQGNVGFFGDYSGTVKNLRLTNINITGSTPVGGLVGYCASGTITNCSTTGKIGSGAQYLGGLVGEAINSAIDSCFSTVSFNSTGGSFIGGFVGYSQETAISNCYSTGNIGGSSGGFELGGFAGGNEGGSGGHLTNCYSTGNVIDSSTSQNVGGFVGKNFSGGNIHKCYSTGNVQGYSYVGGFVGWNLPSCLIENSYSRGNAVSNGGTYVGGLVGFNDSPNGFIDTCYSTGNASGGTGFVGGLVGFNGGFVDSCFWDTLTSGLSSSAAGTGKSTAQMKTQSTFTSSGWDATVWNMDGATNDGYPYLAWQNSGGTPLPVEVASLSAVALNTSVGLKWTTATEVNNGGWEVERKAELGVVSDDWVKAGFVKGAGTSISPRQYSFSDPNLAAGTYAYRLKQIDRSGSFKYSSEVTVAVGTAPRVFTLSQNYPNPFNPTTTIEFTIPADGRVVLKVYDIVGREVATLLDEDMKAGVFQRAVFDATRLSSGIYFARLESGGKHLLKKMMLMK